MEQKLTPELENLYAKAFVYKKTKLWKKMWDTEVVAIRYSDGTMGYCSILGRLGEHIAVVAYEGADGLDSLREICREEIGEELPPVMMERMLSQTSVSCSFVNKDDLREPEIELVREYCRTHDIKLRGKNAWPQLERFLPNHFPWRIQDETDMLHLGEALDVCIELAARLENETKQELLLYKGLDPGKPVSLAKIEEDGTISWSRTVLPEYHTPTYEPTVDYDMQLLEKVRKSKKHVKQWMCDVFLSPEAVSEEAEPGGIIENPTKAPYYPLLQIIADGNEIIACQACSKEEDYAKYFANMALEQMLEKGKPAKIIVCNDRTYQIYADIAAKLGISLVKVERCRELEVMEEDFYRYVQGDEAYEELQDDEPFDEWDDVDDDWGDIDDEWDDVDDDWDDIDDEWDDVDDDGEDDIYGKLCKEDARKVLDGEEDDISEKDVMAIIEIIENTSDFSSFTAEEIFILYSIAAVIPKQFVPKAQMKKLRQEFDRKCR